MKKETTGSAADLICKMKIKETKIAIGRGSKARVSRKLAGREQGQNSIAIQEAWLHLRARHHHLTGSPVLSPFYLASAVCPDAKAIFEAKN